MKAESFVSNGKIYTSVSFTAQEMNFDYIKVDTKENYKMANKTFSIIDNGAAIDPRYTIKYRFYDNGDCAYVTKDLANLSVDELKTLRNSLDNLILDETPEDKIRGFSAELRKLATRYNAEGRLFAGEIHADYDNDVNNPSYMSIAGSKIEEFSFSRYGVTTTKTETIRA